VIDQIEISVTVNGKPYSGSVEPRLLLCDFLRHRAGLTGTHVGCEQGVCGACTISLNGRTARSCLTFAVQADGAEIKTIEGVAGDGSLTPLQTAFHHCHALQCGFCTPGFIMVLTEFLERTPSPSEQDIISAISANLCRCTGYVNMIEAVKQVAAATASIKP
jgi:aerobic-type carbon monoxide dehydrogenase small subunit (CoxS/CutS family)